MLKLSLDIQLNKIYNAPKREKNMKQLFFITLFSSIIFWNTSVLSNTSSGDDVKPCANESLCDASNQPITGIVKFYYPNGNVKKIGYYNNGKREGLTKTYYKNGKLRTEGYIKDGKELLKGYYKNGNMHGEWHYKDGQQEGLAKTFHLNGKIESEVVYKSGKPDGIVRTYYDNGKLESESMYQNGQPNGIARTYLKDGKLKMEILFKNSIAVAGYEYQDNTKTKMSQTHLDNHQNGLKQIKTIM